MRGPPDAGPFRLMTKIDERSPDVELDAEKIERLARALDKAGVVAAFIFGSQASGKVSPLSDVDIGVWLDPAIDKRQRSDRRVRMIGDACSALRTNEVDLVVLNDAPPLLQHRAISNRRMVLDRDPKARVRLEARALLDYLDTKPLRDELTRGLRNRLAEGRFGRR